MADALASTGTIALSASITLELTAVDGKVTTTSQQIADHFGKTHKSVLRAIRNLASELDGAHQFHRIKA